MTPDIDPQIQSRVETPAIALLVLGGLNLLSSLGVALYVVVMGVTGGIAASEGQMAPAELVGQLTGAACSGVLTFAFAIVIILGALRMKKLESYGMAMGASVLAMLPCSSACCLIGLPIGIWCLVTLNDEEVKEAFGRAALAT
jgi:hypothetical protein